MKLSYLFLASLCFVTGCSQQPADIPPRTEPAPSKKADMTHSTSPDANDNGESVTVPPGHKVVVVHATENAALARCESGIWIAQMGTGVDHRSVLDELKKLAKDDQQQNVIWIMPPEFLDTLADQASFMSEVASIVKSSQGKIGHTAVLPRASAKHKSVMAQLRDFGIGVHYSADDGACFVEVHKPDGIVVGMPGPAHSE